MLTLKLTEEQMAALKGIVSLYSADRKDSLKLLEGRDWGGQSDIAQMGIKDHRASLFAADELLGKIQAAIDSGDE